jgi:hypothetical protein
MKLCCLTYKYPLLLIALLFTGCIASPPKPQRSILQMRELQTREFQISDHTIVMRAVLNSLQDSGFIVKNAVTELGLLTASKERDLSGRNSWDTVFYSAFSDHEVRWPKTESTEANATISQFGRTVKVRITFQKKILDNLGGTVEVSEIDDPFFYQDFFSLIEHSIFLQREKV